MSKDPTCAERIAEQLSGRLELFGALDTLAGANAETDGRPDLHEIAARIEIESDDLDLSSDRGADELRERATQRRYEIPLGVSSYRVFRVDLSTGGPGDWLEIVTSGDMPAYEITRAPGSQELSGEAYEIERIVYHFADWFDHAETELRGDDLATATAFVSAVIPELID